MKNNYGFSNILLIGLIIVIVSFGGYFVINNFFQKKQSSEIPVNTNQELLNENNNLQVCKDFNELSDFVTKTISKPQEIYDQESVKMSYDTPYVEKFFTLTTGNSNDPLLAYPVIVGTYYTYQSYKGPYKSNEELQKIYDTNLNLLNEKLNEKTQLLGFVPDEINNVVKNIRNKRNKFAFIKGQSIYSVELEYFHGVQAIGEHHISVTCGIALQDYTDLYDYVINSNKIKWKEGEYIRLLDKSEDGKVFAIDNSFILTSIATGGPSLGFTPIYYIKNQNSYQFVTRAESNFGDCSFFENLKIGKGLNCMRDWKTFGKVTY